MLVFSDMFFDVVMLSVLCQQQFKETSVDVLLYRYSTTSIPLRHAKGYPRSIVPVTYPS